MSSNEERIPKFIHINEENHFEGNYIFIINIFKLIDLYSILSGVQMDIPITICDSYDHEESSAYLFVDSKLIL